MNLIPISHARHGQLAVMPNHSFYQFASKDSVVPVVAAELSQLIPAMPLAFLSHNDSYLLVGVMSLLPGLNIFVAPTTGQWMGTYVPAALRAYPFGIVKDATTGELVVCIREDSGLLVAREQGAELFDSDGEPSRTLRQAMDFLKQTERNREVTQVAVDMLGRTGLIRPWNLQTERDGVAVPLEGLFCIDEAALNETEASVIGSLRDSGALAIAYAQLFSTNQLQVLNKLREVSAQLQLQAQSSPSTQLAADFLSGRETISFGAAG